MTYNIERCIRRSRQLRGVQYGAADVSISKAIKQILLRKGIKDVSEKGEFKRKLGLSLEQIRGVSVLIRQLSMLRTVQFNWSDEEHVKLLETLWEKLRPEIRRRFGRITSEWQEIGFQGDDPATDFRGMGLLGLQNLVHFSTNYPLLARWISNKYEKGGIKYPSFAITGINLSGDAFSLLVRRDASPFFYENDVSLESFHDFYAWCWYEFDSEWTRSEPKDIMEFPMVHEQFLQRMRTLLRAGELMDLQALKRFDPALDDSEEI